MLLAAWKLSTDSLQNPERPRPRPPRRSPALHLLRPHPALRGHPRTQPRSQHSSSAKRRRRRNGPFSVRRAGIEVLQRGDPDTLELCGYGGDTVEGYDSDGICGVAWVRICASSDRDCGDSYVVDGSGLREVKGYLGEARGFFPNRV